MVCGCLRMMGQQTPLRTTETGTMEPTDMGGTSQSESFGEAGEETKESLESRIVGDEKEAEMEDNMQQIGNMLNNLRNMALDMNAEVADQNEQMDRITVKVDIEFYHRKLRVQLCKC